MRLNVTTEKGKTVNRLILDDQERANLVTLLRDIRQFVDVIGLQPVTPVPNAHSFNSKNWLTLDHEIPLGLEIQVGAIGHHVDGEFNGTTLNPTGTAIHKYSLKIDPSTDQIKHLNKAIRKLNKLTGSTYSEYRVPTKLNTLNTDEARDRMESKRDEILNWVLKCAPAFREYGFPADGADPIINIELFITRMAGTGYNRKDIELAEKLRTILYPPKTTVSEDGLWVITG